MNSSSMFNSQNLSKWTTTNCRTLEFQMHSGFTQALKQMVKCSKILAKYKPTLSNYNSKQKNMEMLLSSP